MVNEAPPFASSDLSAPSVPPIPVAPRDFYFCTPRGQILLAILMLILAGATSAATVIILRESVFTDSTQEIIARYAAFGVSTVFLMISLMMMLVGSIRWALFGPHSPAEARLDGEGLKQDLALIHERLLLSETAKKVAFRREDVALLHDTIRQDIADHDYNSAMVLVESLGGIYGQLHEAESFRSEIAQIRTADQEAKVEAGVLEMDRLLTAYNFGAARREAARLVRLYPDAPSVDGLTDWVNRSKAQYKTKLKEEFFQAKERNEIDKAVVLMTQLDKVLTPTEAEPFQDAAREVFAKKRDNLGLQFKLAVHDKEWVTAVNVGEEIIRDFPNSRMADEVRERLSVLQSHASASSETPPKPIQLPETT